MKYFAILSVLILIVTLVGVGYLYMNANIYVEAVGVVAVDAPSQADLFASAKEQQAKAFLCGEENVTKFHF